MIFHYEPQGQLQDSVPASRLFADWLIGNLDADFLEVVHRDAGEENVLALGGGSPPVVGMPGPAPLFESAWVDGWAESILEDMPQGDDQTVFRKNLSALRAGKADVVVTGQQPGYLGGPLYTLYKVATAVALARRRTAAGRLTVPVFWSGDDDDDLAEALAPVAWDPGTGELFPSPGYFGKPGRSPMVGRLAADQRSAETADWLERVSRTAGSGESRLPADLATIWREAVAEGWTWSRLARRSLLRVYSGCGLMVVSGDDSGLHQVASPLYDKILSRTGELADLTAQRGRELAAGGWHAQIQARSLAQPIFRIEDDRRVVYQHGHQEYQPGNLRPGVMLRSPVQDWLLRPAAVVVGPGELAYLRQLDPIYEALDIPRSPLVPRLFAWLLPPNFDRAGLKAFRELNDSDPDLADRLAGEAESRARGALADILARELGVDAERAESLAEGRARRWRKGVSAMLGDEIKRLNRDRAPTDPVWVFPEGKRQERHLAYLCAAALWGDGLVAACLEVADKHLDYGTRKSWREFTIEVPAP